MDGDLSLLSLKWNNHNTAFLHIIGNLRSKSSYADATLACNGKFYPVHRLVLSTCSEYFCDIFELTNCKNPVIVLKDVECKNLEYLLDYMYIGEVNVKQNELASLVGAAEYLQIKGLAVPDEDLTQKRISSHKRASDCHRGSSPPVKKKRILRDILESGNNSDKDRVESSDISKSPDIPKNQKSNLHEPSFISIKCEPQSDDDIVEDFVSVSETKISSKNSCGQIGNKNTNHLETEKDLVEKEEPFDLSEEDMIQPGPSGMYENDQYQPDISGSIDSDASLSQIPEDAVEKWPEEVETHSSIHDVATSFPNGSYDSNRSNETLSEADMIFNQENTSCSRSKTNFAATRECGVVKFCGVTFKVVLGNNSRCYKCSLCQLPIYNYTEVQEHSLLHSRGKPFNCNLCDYKAQFKSTMKVHMRMHTGEKPFGCKVCNYKTAYKHRLQSHVASKHCN